jgi:hypothetical protein
VTSWFHSEGKEFTRTVVFFENDLIESEELPLPAECIQAQLDLGRSGARKLVGAFAGGAITSNGAMTLLAVAERQLKRVERLAVCCTECSVA